MFRANFNLSEENKKKWELKIVKDSFLVGAQIASHTLAEQKSIWFEVRMLNVGSILPVDVFFQSYSMLLLDGVSTNFFIPPSKTSFPKGYQNQRVYLLIPMVLILIQ